MNNHGTGRELKRALRRHHRARMIAYAREVTGRFWGFTPDELRRKAVRIRDHLAACSCWMCGNPRRYWGERTWQEIRTAALPKRGGRGLLEERD